MKVLCYLETPVIQTGGGRVSQPLVKLMHSLGWELTIVGLNHFGDVPFSQEEWPHKFINADAGDFFQPIHAKEQILAGGYDLLFLSGDINVLDAVMPQALAAQKVWKFPIISLAAVDADFDMQYLGNLLNVNYPVVYSDFAYRVCTKRLEALKEKLTCIPLWFEPDTLYRMDDVKRHKIRQEILGIDDLETFVVISVNRNQRRKDLGRVMYAYHLFHEKYPNSILYMHAKRDDYGGDLASMAHLLDINVFPLRSGKPSEIVYAHDTYSVVVGYTREVINQIYNAGDVSISCSQGEGWGLSTSESMAAGIPFIGPQHTTFIDLIGANEERGYLARAGGPDLWQIHYEKGLEPRPVTSATNMAAKLEHVYLHREEAMGKAAVARVYAECHGLDRFNDEWLALFKKVESKVSSDRHQKSAG